jgi:pimeloyl-ACP methyl ester carboxylesterase
VSSRTLEPLERWRARGSIRPVLGRSLFGVDTGAAATATPVVLIHGFPTCSLDWSGVLPRLAATRRVLALDLLGFGLSEKPWPHDYTIDEQVDLVEAWLAQAGVARAHVLSHDMGDTVLQEMLARRLEGRAGVALASVVLLNGGIIVELTRPILAQKVLRSRLLGGLAARAIGRGGFGRSLRGIAARGRQPTEEELDDLYRALVSNDGKRVFSSSIHYMDERVARRDRWRGATLTHPFPMRLVWGDRDPISGFDIAREVARERPATDVVRLEGTGHYPQVEEPERVAAAALEWFARHEA